MSSTDQIVAFAIGVCLIVIFVALIVVAVLVVDRLGCVARRNRHTGPSAVDMAIWEKWRESRKSGEVEEPVPDEWYEEARKSTVKFDREGKFTKDKA